MQSKKFIEEMGLLAELSYVDFKKKSLSKDENTSWIDNAKKDIENSLDDDATQEEKDRVEKILKPLLSTYEIVDFIDHGTPEGLIGSDLQMLLLKDKEGKFTIAYRGTAGFHDAVVTDLGQMGLKLDDNDQFIESLAETQKWITEYGLNKQNTTFTGHSLGGALAQLNSYVYGYETYTINAFGFDAASTDGTLNINAIYSKLKNLSTVY